MPLPHVLPPQELNDDLGCFVFLAIFAAFAVIVVALTGVMWLIVPVVTIALALAVFIGKQKIGIQLGLRELEERELAGLLVYSDSPLWRTRIESEWLPRLGDRVAVLNWSDRRSWDADDPLVRLYRGCGARPPVLIALRKERRPLVFAFAPAFRNAKLGSGEELEGLEKRMFGMIYAG